MIGMILAGWSSCECHIHKSTHTFPMLNQCFYETHTIFPQLSSIIKRLNVLDELGDYFGDWETWPEDLANNKDGWKTIPIFGFGHWSQTSKSFPRLVQALKQIPNVRLAAFSKFKPGTKLSPHQGYGSYSNFVLRSHLVLRLPARKGMCHLFVEDECYTYGSSKKPKEDEWITFDDSKMHYAANDDEQEDRIVFIIDIDRPKHVKIGTSNSHDTKEMIEYVNQNKVKFQPSISSSKSTYNLNKMENEESEESEASEASDESDGESDGVIDASVEDKLQKELVDKITQTLFLRH